MGNAHGFCSLPADGPSRCAANFDSRRAAEKGFQAGKGRRKMRSRFVLTKKFGRGKKRHNEHISGEGGVYGSRQTAGTSSATTAGTGLSVTAGSRLSSAAACCFRADGSSATNPLHPQEGASAAADECDDIGGDEAKMSSGKRLAMAAIGAAASSRRSALSRGSRRRSSAEKAAMRVNLSTRRSAINVRATRRVSPGEDAIRSILMLREAAKDLEDEIDRSGSDGGAHVDGRNARRGSSLVRRRRSSSLSKARQRHAPFAVSLESCKPGPVPPHRPECLGTIRYRYTGREGLGKAREESLQTGRPILVATYRRHLCCGKMPLGPHRNENDNELNEEPLSHPLLVEAAESLFVPVLLEVTDEEYGDFHDRRRNDDTNGDALSYSSVTADCFQTGGGATLCLTDSHGTLSPSDLLVPDLPRRSWTAGSVASAMACALQSTGASTVPPYLDLLIESEGRSCQSSTCRGNGLCATPAHKEAYLGTSDARRAEAELARLDGVSSTGAGWIDRQRAVRVTYDPSRLSFGILLRCALAMDAADEAVYVSGGEERIAARMELDRRRRAMATAATTTAMGCYRTSLSPRHCCSFVRSYPESSPSPFRPTDAAERKVSLRSTPLCHVPLTGLQSARANMLVRGGRFDEAVRLLSPRQGVIFMAALKQKMKRQGIKGESSSNSNLLLPDLTDVPLIEAWRQLVDCGFFD